MVKKAIFLYFLDENQLFFLQIYAFSDNMEVRQITTRKLRRRPNDPTPAPEKRRKASPAQLNFFLDDEEILEDILILNKVS